MNNKSIQVDLVTPIEDQIRQLGITNYIDLSRLSDLYPSREYLDDMDDGKSMCGISPNDAREQFKSKGRQGLTLREGLAFFRANPKILKSHNLDFVGARYCEGSVPGLYVGGGKPALGNRWGDDALPGWGAPSAGSVSDIDTRNLGSLESRIKNIEIWIQSFPKL